jgi:hypothetical protein
MDDDKGFRISVVGKGMALGATAIMELPDSGEVGEYIVPVCTVEKTRKKIVRKTPTPIVQPENRRFTTSCLVNNGFRPQPVIAKKMSSKKRSRAKPLLVEPITENKEEDQGKNSPEE